MRYGLKGIGWKNCFGKRFEHVGVTSVVRVKSQLGLWLVFSTKTLMSEIEYADSAGELCKLLINLFDHYDRVDGMKIKHTYENAKKKEYQRIK